MKKNGQPAVNVGDVTTLDHIIARGETSKGMDGEKNCVMAYDVAADWLSAIPVKSKHANRAYNAMIQHSGRTKLRLVHSDGSKELAKACRMHGVPQETSLPNDPQGNGLAESMVRVEKDGCRCDLTQSGHPACFWPLGVVHFAFARNIQQRDGEGSGQQVAGH